jgi:hypothetical protein
VADWFTLMEVYGLEPDEGLMMLAMAFAAITGGAISWPPMVWVESVELDEE